MIATSTEQQRRGVEFGKGGSGFRVKPLRMGVDRVQMFHWTPKALPASNEASTSLSYAANTHHDYEKEHGIVQASLATAKQAASLQGDSNTTSLNTALLSASAACAAAQLAKKHSNGNKPACTSGEVSAAQRHAEDAMATPAHYVHNLLNGCNTQPGLNWLALPFSLSLPLLDACLEGGFIYPDGQPVLRPQPLQPYTVDLQGYLKTSTKTPSFVGHYNEKFGTSDMEVVPDAYPWVNKSELAELLTCSLVESYLYSFPAGRQLVEAKADLGLSSSSGMSAHTGSVRSLILWSSLLVTKYAAAFMQQHISSAKCVVAAAASAPRSRPGAAAVLTSSSGGNSGRFVVTAVGGDDEGEIEAVSVAKLHARKFGDEEGGSSEQKQQGSITSVMVPGVVLLKSRKGWWQRVAGAGQRMFECLSEH